MDGLEEQLNGNPVEDDVERAYRFLAQAYLPPGMTVRTASHGFVARELRFEQDGHWLYAAVLNQKWVLWYFRRPALRQGIVDAHTTLREFPEAKLTNGGEVTLRLRDVATARAVIDWIA